MFKSLKNTWFIRTKTNLVLTAVSVAVVGSIAKTLYNEVKSDHPIVNFIVQQLSKKQMIAENVGIPCVKSIGIRSRIQSNEKYCHFEFILKGPKGSANMIVDGQSLTLKELRNQPDLLKQREICQKIKSQLTQAKPNSELQIELSQKLTQCETSQRRIDSKIKGEYHLADQKLEKKLFKLKKNKENFIQKLQEQQRFWKIANLTMNCVGQNEVQIKLAPKKNVSARMTYQDLLTQVQIQKNFDSLSVLQKQELKQRRIKSIYAKNDSVRTILFLAIMLAFGVFITFGLKKNKTSLVNSAFHQDLIALATNNKKIGKVLGQPYHISRLVKGSREGNLGRVRIELFGKQEMGELIGQGVMNEEKLEWKIQEARVQFRKDLSSIDLLK